MSELKLAVNWIRVAIAFRCIPPWNARFIALPPYEFTKQEIQIAKELSKKLVVEDEQS